MKKRLWYFYFGASVFLAVTGALGYLSQPAKYNPVMLLYVIDFILSVTGTFAYLWKKKLFIPQFWLLFFILNIVLDASYLLYSAAPNVPYIKSLAFLNPEGVIDSFGYNLISALFDVPMLFAVFNLSRDRYFNPELLRKKDARKPGWNMFQTALWGYSTVFMGLILLFSFLLQPDASDSQTDVLISSASFLPLAIFWLMVVFRYKEYPWNWWRTTLVLNSLLYTGMIFYGILSPAAPSHQSGIDFISIAETLLLFISLIVFGRDQSKLRK
jgi:hypothetical protein